MNKSALVPVQFTRSYSPYTQGEIAGFTRDKSERLVQAGVARYYNRQMAADRREREEEDERENRRDLRRHVDGNYRQRHAEGEPLGSGRGNEPPGMMDVGTQPPVEEELGPAVDKYDEEGEEVDPAEFRGEPEPADADDEDDEDGDDGVKASGGKRKSKKRKSKAKQRTRLKESSDDSGDDD